MIIVATMKNGTSSSFRHQSHSDFRKTHLQSIITELTERVAALESEIAYLKSNRKGVIPKSVSRSISPCEDLSSYLSQQNQHHSSCEQVDIGSPHGLLFVTSSPPPSGWIKPSIHHHA